MVKKAIISVLGLLLISSMLLSTPAGAVPQPPHVFRGNVTVGGNAAADGLTVTAAIAGANFPYSPSALTSGGRYGDDLMFRVPSDDPDTATKEGGVDGDTIVFYVQGVTAGTSTFKMGEITTINLAIAALSALAKPTNIQRTTPITDNTPTFTWNAVTNAVSYQVRKDTDNFAGVGNVTTYTFSTVADGSHYFEVRGVDTFGYAGASSDLYAFTIDTTPPTVTITALSPDPNTDNTSTLSGTATDATTTIASIQYRVDGGTWTAATAVDGTFNAASESYTFTTSTLNDGAHTVEVRATDAAGNTTTVYASDTFTIDTTPPTVTITYFAPVLNDNTPTFTGTATDATTTIASAQYRVDGGPWIAATAVDGTFNAASESFTFTTSTLANGAHSGEIKVTDAAGNTTTIYGTGTIDATPPTVTITALTPDPTTNNTPTFSGTTTDATTTIASVQFRVDSGSWTAATAVDGTFNAASESYTFTTSTLDDGAHTVDVKATDAAGNTTTVYASDTFTTDATPPTVTITALTPDPTTNNTPTFTGTATDATTTVASVQYRVDGGTWTAATAVDGTFNAASESYTFTTSTLIDGAHTVEVKATDAAGNTTPTANYASDTFTVETVPAVLPAPTNIQWITPITDNTPTFTWNAVTNAVSYQVRVDTASWSNVGNVTTYTFTTIIPDDTHTFQAKGVNALGTAGLSGSVNFTIDTTPPAVTITPLTPDPTTDNTPTFSGTATDATTTIASVQFRVDSGSWTATTAVDGTFNTASESYTFTTSTLIDGAHTVEVKATDAAGNTTTVYASDTFTVTTVAPVVAAPPAVVIPTAETVTAMTTEQAAATVETLAAAAAADIIEEVATAKAAEIVSTVTTAKAAEIVSTVTTAKATDIIETVATAKAAEIVSTVTTAKAADIIETVATAKAASIIQEVVTAKAAEIVSNVTSAKATEIVSNVTTAKATEIVSNVTTAKATEIVSNVTSAKATEIVSNVASAKAAEIVSNVASAKAAEIVSNVTIAKATEIVSTVTIAKATEIVSTVTIAKASEIVSTVTTAKASEIVSTVTTAKATDIIETVATAKAAEIIQEVATAKAASIIQEVVTAKASEIVSTVTTAKAAGILENVAPDKAAPVMEGLTTGKLTNVIPAMSETSLTQRLPGLSTEKLYSIEPKVLFDSLPNAPTEQLVSEEPPQPPAELGPPVSVYTTPSGARYMAIRTMANEWVVVMGTPPPIEELLIKTKRALENVQTTLEVFEKQPPQVTISLPAGQIARAYITINFENATPEDIEVGHITFKVEKAWLTQNSIHKWSVTLNRYDPGLGQWISLPSKRVKEDETGVYYTTAITQFSTFAISGSQEVPALKFKVTNLNINPTEVQTGQSITINAEVTNISNTDGIYVATLWIDNTIETGKNLPLKAGEKKSVTFTVTRGVEGSYNIRLDRLFGSFKVTKAPPITPPIAPPEELPPPPVEVVKPPINWWPIIGGIMAGVVIIAVIVWLAIRRRRTTS